MSVSQQPARPAVLAAKVTPPEPRRDMVARPELVRRLESAGPRAVRVIVAPAGWGKSELVTQWSAARTDPVAYLQLDANDVDAVRCWAHVVAAVGAATGVAVDDLLATLRVPGVPLVAAIVEPLLVRLERHTVTLVLEDLHLAATAELDEALSAFIDARPAGVGVVVTSRAEPSIDIPRRRLRGDLVEIRRDELGVGVDAAREIVATASGHHLDDAQVAVLLDRTEGWPAGLYLAGLSLRSATDPAAAIADFSGDDRNLGEYLAAEVFARLDADTRGFLTGTAVLHELDGPICDAMLGRTGSGAVLERLAHRNSFLIPLDERAGRYRYHHLFREWLLAELGRADPSAVPASHRRATAAYDDAGDPVTATEHALASGDAALAYAHVGDQNYAVLDTGRHATAIRWYRSLPPAPSAEVALEADVVRAFAAAIEGDIDTIDRLCARMERVLDDGEVDAASSEHVGDADVLRAYAAMLRGRFGDAESWLREAAERPRPARIRVTLTNVSAIVGFWLGRSSTAVLEESVALARRDGVPYAVVQCETYLALDAALRDDADAADRWFVAATGTVDEYPATYNYLAAAFVARARMRALGGDLTGAESDGQHAIELAERRTDVPVASVARLVLADVRSGAGDRAGAKALVDIVEQDLAPLGDSGILGDLLDVRRRQLRLQQRPATRPAGFGEPVEELTDRELALLRLLPGDLTQRELGEALHLSFNTVKAYNRQIYRKLGVSSRDEAVAAARRHGIL